MTEKETQIEEFVLSDWQIAKRLVHEDPSKKLCITPLINVDHQLGSSSIDLRLGTEFEVIMTTQCAYLDLLGKETEVEKEVKRYTKRIKLRLRERFILHPGEFALGSTLEFIKMPIDLAGRLEGRSTWGRLGLQIHSTAGFVDPGFKGSLTFELQNAGKLAIPLFPGLRIAQLSLYRCDGVALPYPSKAIATYLDQHGTKGSRFYIEPEIKYLREEEKKRRSDTANQEQESEY